MSGGLVMREVLVWDGGVRGLQADPTAMSVINMSTTHQQWAVLTYRAIDTNWTFLSRSTLRSVVSAACNETDACGKSLT